MRFSFSILFFIDKTAKSTETQKHITHKQADTLILTAENKIIFKNPTENNVNKDNGIKKQKSKYREKKYKWIVLIYYNEVYCYRLVNSRFITLSKVSAVFVYLFSAEQ